MSPENFHITLKFLGAVDDRRIADVSDAVMRVAAATPRFGISVRGLDAFPSQMRARVLWAGITDDARRLAALGEAVDAALGPLGFERESRPFAGHVTLGRVREPRRQPALADAVAVAARREFGALTVERASVMRSDLSPRGARYSELTACPLA